MLSFYIKYSLFQASFCRLYCSFNDQRANVAYCSVLSLLMMMLDEPTLDFQLELARRMNTITYSAGGMFNCIPRFALGHFLNQRSKASLEDTHDCTKGDAVAINDKMEFC